MPLIVDLMLISKSNKMVPFLGLTCVTADVLEVVPSQERPQPPLTKTLTTTPVHALTHTTERLFSSVLLCQPPPQTGNLSFHSSAPPSLTLFLSLPASLRLCFSPIFTSLPPPSFLTPLSPSAPLLAANWPNLFSKFPDMSVAYVAEFTN